MTLNPLLLADNVLPYLMFTAGCALLTAILLRKTYRRLGSHKKQDKGLMATLPRPKGAWDGAQTTSVAQVERAKVELHEMGRDVVGQIDSKLIVLQELIVKSQAQIDRLEELLDEVDAAKSASDR